MPALGLTDHGALYGAIDFYTLCRDAGIKPIIGGDMNAEPGDLEMSLFAEAGFGDLGEPAGPTTTMSNPPKRIDYIWGIGVTTQSPPLTIGSLGASDHLAVVVNVTKP